MAGQLKPLFDAVNGLPDEPRAVRVIATYSIMPAVCAGIVAGAFALPVSTPFGWLIAAAAGGAVVGAGLTIAVVLLTHRLFGFRAVVRVGEAVGGLFVGFFAGVLLCSLFQLDWWPLLLAPAFAVLNIIFRPFTRTRPTPPTPGEREQPDE